MSKKYVYYEPIILTNFTFPKFCKFAIIIGKELEESNYTKSKTFDLLMNNYNASIIFLSQKLQNLSMFYDLKYFKYIKDKYRELYNNIPIINNAIERIENAYKFIETSKSIIRSELPEEEYNKILEVANEYLIGIEYEENSTYNFSINQSAYSYNPHNIKFTDKEGRELVFSSLVEKNKSDNSIENETYIAIQTCLDVLQLYSEKTGEMKLIKSIALLKLNEYINISFVNKNGKSTDISFLDNINIKKRNRVK